MLYNEPRQTMRKDKEAPQVMGKVQEQITHTKKENQMLNHHVGKNAFPLRDVKGTRTFINAIPFKLTNILTHGVMHSTTE